MTSGPERQLLRKLGLRDAILIVMGGIVGSGIFMNPAVVAKNVHTGTTIMAAWIIGGIVALLGGSVFAELAARRATSGGLYAYVRDGIHPAVGFAYGWTMLFVSQGGGIAASAMIFAAYLAPLATTGMPAKFLAVALIAAFTLVNCLGVRAGAGIQNAFMLIKIVAIGAFVTIGVVAAPQTDLATSSIQTLSPTTLWALGGALIPVLFSYNGWQTATFMTGELKAPERTLSRGLFLGVLAVVGLYLAVNLVCLRVLGPSGLASTSTPASDVARVVFGPIGQRAMAVIVMMSTLGFISNQVLTAPRVCFQMAVDGTFFRFLSKVNPRTNVPVFAIAQQGLVAIAIAISGTYEQILGYVVSVDYVFYALAGIALIVFRARDAAKPPAEIAFRVPGYPWSAAAFVIISCVMVIVIVGHAPREGLAGLFVIVSGLPVYYLFVRWHQSAGSKELGLT